MIHSRFIQYKLLKHFFKKKKASISKKQSLFIYIHVTDFKKIISDVLEGFSWTMLGNEMYVEIMLAFPTITFINWKSQTIVFKGLKSMMQL